jgi:hypothetical protein
VSAQAVDPRAVVLHRGRDPVAIGAELLDDRCPCGIGLTPMQPRLTPLVRREGENDPEHDEGGLEQGRSKQLGGTLAHDVLGLVRGCSDG